MAPYCKNAMRFLRTECEKRPLSQEGGDCTFWPLPALRTWRPGVFTQPLGFCHRFGKMSMPLPNFEPPPAPPLLENQMPTS